MIRIGGTEITDIAVGSIPIEKAYIGSTLVWEKSSPVLPYDAQVEYLESDGGPYIDLGKTITSNTDTIEIVFAMTELSGSVLKEVISVFGARKGASSKNFTIICNNSADEFCVDLQNATYSTYRLTHAYTKDVFYKIHMEKTLRRVMYEDGTILASKTNTSQNFTTAVSAYLFRFHQSGNTWPYGHSKIKSLVWKRNGADYMNLIPVRKDGVGYMYDKVSGNLFGNVGTGAFTYGNDVT